MTQHFLMYQRERYCFILLFFSMSLRLWLRLSTDFWSVYKLKCGLDIFMIKFYVTGTRYYRGWLFDKNRNFSNWRWRTDVILKIVFGYISAPYWPINVKFGMEMTKHMQIEITTKNGNFPKFKMANGRHFENSFRCLHHSGNELMLPSQCLSTGALV